MSEIIRKDHCAHCGHPPSDHFRDSLACLHAGTDGEALGCGCSGFALTVPMPLRLSAECLLSKWGFSDGLALSEWWWRNDQGTPEPWSVADEKVILRRLVRTHLIPAIESAGHEIEVYDIDTHHNPIRARQFDRREVDDRADNPDPNVTVEVPVQDVMDAIERIVGIAGSVAPAAIAGANTL